MSDTNAQPFKSAITPIKTQQAVVDTVYTERVAREYVAKLVEYGHRASYVRRSRTICEEPYVEHTYDVVLQYQHRDELRASQRILQIPET